MCLRSLLLICILSTALAWRASIQITGTPNRLYGLSASPLYLSALRKRRYLRPIMSGCCPRFKNGGARALHSNEKAIFLQHGVIPGSSQGDLAHLFERYHRGSNVSGIVGTGVGLIRIAIAAALSQPLPLRVFHGASVLGCVVLAWA
jgi:hypothetical protein